MIKRSRLMWIILAALLVLSVGVWYAVLHYVPHNWMLKNLEAEDIESMTIYGRNVEETALLSEDEVKQLLDCFNKVRIIDERPAVKGLMGCAVPGVRVKLTNGAEYDISIMMPFDVYMAVDDTWYLIDCVEDGSNPSPAFENAEEMLRLLNQHSIRYFPEMQSP